MKNIEERVKENESQIRFIKDRLVDLEGNIEKGMARFSRLEIVSHEGQVRIRMGVINQRPTIEFLDVDGKRRMALEILGTTPIITILDERGKIRAALTVINKIPALALYDERGKCVANLTGK